MKEYVVCCKVHGKGIWLQVLLRSSGIYKVYYDANFVGTITPRIDPEFGVLWSTEYQNLKPYLKELADYIMEVDI